MIARGQHIATMNEESAIRKSGDPSVMDTDTPYNAASGGTLPYEITNALSKGFKPDIDDLMAKRQMRD